MAAPQVAAVERWKDGAAIQAWAGGRIYFNRRGTGDLFDGWSALPDGTDERCETSIAAYPVNTHAGVSDVSPDGRWMLVTVERPTSSANGTPGKGSNNDLWIQEAGGSRAWRIRSTLWASYGLIWPRFAGSRIVWAELGYWSPFILWGGGWRLHIADLTWTAAGVPQLVNAKTRQTDGLIEPYGLTADGASVLFTADALFGKGPDSPVIGTLPLTLAGAPKRLSPATPTQFGTNYNEFAFPVPDRDRIVFGRTTGGNNYSVEYWTMKPDGTDAQQLTRFAWPDWPWFHGGDQGNTRSIAGGLAFDPDDPSRFVAGFGIDLSDHYLAEMISLA